MGIMTLCLESQASMYITVYTMLYVWPTWTWLESQPVTFSSALKKSGDYRQTGWLSWAGWLWWFNQTNLYYYRRRVCVCVCAQFDQFLPVRSHFDTKRPVNFFHTATFPSPTFGPLFAFHCPLFFTKNNNLHAAMFWKVTVTTQDRPLNRKHLQPLARVVHW